MFGDYDKAIIEYEKAAAEGNTHAIFNLGLFHEQGLGTEVDLEKAYNYYITAGQQGQR